MIRDRDAVAAAITKPITNTATTTAAAKSPDAASAVASSYYGTAPPVLQAVALRARHWPSLCLLLNAFKGE